MKFNRLIKAGLITTAICASFAIFSNGDSRTGASSAVNGSSIIGKSYTHSSQTPPSAALSTKKRKKPVTHTFNLSNADISAVTEEVSKLTGKNFLVSPDLKQETRKITIYTQHPMSVEEIYQVYLTALQVLGYSAVPAGNVIKVVKANDANESAPPFANAAYPGIGNEVVIRVVTVNNVPINEVVSALKPLAPQSTVIQPYQPNSVILAGYARNITRLAEVLNELDANAGGRVQIVPLFNASADKIVDTLNKLQGPQGSYNSPVKLAADTQNNNVLVRGNSKIRKYYSSLIKRLDMARNTGAGGTEVIHLNYLQAKNLAPVLAKIAQGSIDQLNTQNSSGGSVSISNVQPTSFSGSTSSGKSDGAAETNNSTMVQAVKDSNSLIISAPASVMTSLNNVINQLDTPPRQVLVEAIIARVDQSLINDMGVVWGTSNAETETTDADGNRVTASGFKEGIGYIPHGNIRAVVHLLQQNISTDILATPTIVVLDNNAAVISDGKNIAIQDQQYAATEAGAQPPGNSQLPFTNYDRKDVTLELKVTPQISPDLKVRLKISEHDDTLADPNTSSTTPQINTSKITTSVLADSKSIIVLGGLVSHDQEQQVNKIPILGDFPILGQFFKHRSKNLDRKDLMVFIRPIILQDKSTRNAVTSKRYDFMRGVELDKNAGADLSLYDPGPVLPDVFPAPPKAIPHPFAKVQSLPQPFYEK